MRSVLAVFLLLASLWLATPVYAADEVSEIDVCRDFSLIAKEVMTARQKKLPMSETLPFAITLIEKWAKKYGIEMDSKEAEEGAATVVIPAYERRAYPSDSLWKQERQDAIRDFENLFFEECYTGLTSDSEYATAD